MTHSLYLIPIDCPPTKVMLSELSGALINTNNVLDYPRLKPSTFINIGGIQIARKPELPTEIQLFLDHSHHGAVLFTMGFIFDPSFVPYHRIQSLLEVFGSLKQRVIMKLDISKGNLTIPPNVMVLPFLPQVSVFGMLK